MLSRMSNRQRGFTLIELLIVVAIIGIIAAILIPNFLDALQKGRQKRSMGDMRETATAVHAFYTDIGGAAAAGQATTVDFDAVGGTSPATDAQTIAAQLVPQYIQEIRESDGWGNSLTFRVSLTNPPSLNYMGICSQGRDGSGGCSGQYNVGAFDATDYDQDLVLIDGSFVRYPAGTGASGGGTP